MRASSFVPLKHFLRAGKRLRKSGSKGKNGGASEVAPEAVMAPAPESTATTTPVPSSDNDFLSSAGGIAVFVVILILAVLYIVGVCTIFNRSNPKLNGAVKVLMYIVLVLILGPFYIAYFVIRMGVQGIRGKPDYKTLPFPSPFFKAKKGV